MERNFDRVLYYQTYKNNQLLHIYVYDEESPTKYRIESIKDYNEINSILEIIDEKMLKIGRAIKNDKITKINYFPHDSRKIEIDYDKTKNKKELIDSQSIEADFKNIDYNNVLKIIKKQESIENSIKQNINNYINKDINGKASNKKGIKKALSLALAAAIILGAYCGVNKLAKNQNRNINKFSTMQPTLAPTYIPTMVPTVEPTQVSTAIPTIEPTVIPTITPTVIPTVEPTIVPTVVPTTVPTAKPTMVPTTVPTPKSIEKERKLGEETIKPIQNMSLSEQEDILAQELNEATIKVSNLKKIETENINKGIFTDLNSSKAAIKIVNSDFEFKETTFDETASYKGIVLINEAATSYFITGDETIALSNYIIDEEKKTAVKEVEKELTIFKDGVNNEDKLVEILRGIQKNTTYETKEVDFINVSYIAAASQSFKTRTDVLDEIVMLQGQLMIEINEYCHQPSFSK